MARKDHPPQPTPAELAILQALWKKGPATVREIHDELNQASRTAYTTTLKFLQIMLEKGFVVREDSKRSHVYEARYSEAEVQRVLTDDLLQRVFGGSASSLMLQALNGRKAKRGELGKIRKLIDEMEGK